ncbi:MAG: hypothetical protein ACRETA_07235 [Gammaproteobacteria bacterium]
MSEESDSKQIVLLQFLVEQSYLRSEWSAARSYMNAERNLLILVNVALTCMVLGISVDRFGLLLHRQPWPAIHSVLNAPAWESVVLIALGALMMLLAGVRYLPFIFAYRRNRHMPLRFGAILPPMFTFLFAIYGIAMLVIFLIR